MSIKRKIVVPVEITLYLPEHHDDGSTTRSVRFLTSSGDLTDHDGKSRLCGSNGGNLWIYTDEGAVEVDAIQLWMGYLKTLDVRKEEVTDGRG